MIYLVRHGETAFNAAGRMQGALDSPLTARGLSQAQRMGVTLKGLVRRPFAIVASPQGRAQHTARIIAEVLGTNAVGADARLREITLGSWDGRTHREVDATHPGLRDRVDWHFHAPDGESYQAMRERLGAWLKDARGQADDLVAVSHGVAGRVLRGLVMGMTPEQALSLQIPQDAVFRLHADRVERIDCAPAD